MINEAIILAGGLGTRLRSAVPDLPKSMAPVAGKPFISYVIKYYQRQGIEKFIFSLGYKHELIEQFLHKEFNTLSYSVIVEPEPIGTGGAIYQGCLNATTYQVLILNGDTFFETDIRSLSLFHEKNNADCTLCLKEMTNTDRYGVVEMSDDGRIISFKEKNFYERSVINGGVYALNVSSLINEKMPQKFSFEKDFFEKYYMHKKIYGLKQNGYFIDIGIPDDFERAQTDFKYM
ncbi:MAG TPA: nucleotidyltransferase family protein [Flavitalea sp.]|nr:nucleotidyltransferase family protein [Flavitalea sp.]